jgi:hypothetical protein
MKACLSPLPFIFLLIYFLTFNSFIVYFELAYINNTREFCDNSIHTNCVLWTNSPLHIFPFLPSFSNSVGGFHYVSYIRLTYVYTYIKRERNSDALHPSVSLLYPSLLHRFPRHIHPLLSHSCPITIIITTIITITILGLGSTNEKKHVKFSVYSRH